MVSPIADPPQPARASTPRARAPRRSSEEAGPAHGGRPRDEDLTARLLDVAVGLLADGGMSLLTIERVASRAKAGRPAVYRRWPDVHHLAADAVRSRRLVPATPVTGSLVGDLATLMHPWTRELEPDERAAAALLGAARTSPTVHAALDEVVRWPLSAALARAVGAERARGRTVPGAHEGFADRVLRALWWSRYVDDPPPLRGQQVVALVERALVPLLHAR